MVDGLQWRGTADRGKSRGRHCLRRQPHAGLCIHGRKNRRCRRGVQRKRQSGTHLQRQPCIGGAPELAGKEAGG